MMLDTEVLWNKALTDNNVRGIICWLRHITTEDKCSAEKSLVSFSSWLQQLVELTKKELLTLCFGQCEGLWMFLDQSSFNKVHLLTQKLKNLLTLVCLGKTHTGCLHPAHVSRCTCWKCRVGGGNMLVQDQDTLRQHILLGRLVEWWGLTGLLPQYPDALELKQISQMWCEMDQNQKRACLELRCDIEDKCRWSSLIQSIVAHLDTQYGPLWSEDCSYQTYPPPSLQALLNLVLVPHIDITSVQAIILYFVLDVSNFMHCKDNLLESFCCTFSIPSSFSQQIHGFWLLDHGFVSDSMEMLLSPKASFLRLDFLHRAVLRMLLRQGEHQTALKYLYSNKPAIENIQDARLWVDVLLQNKRVSEAWVLLRQGQPGNEHLLKHFIHRCENLCVCGEALTSVCKEMLRLYLTEKPDSSIIKSINEDLREKSVNNKLQLKDQTPRPLSAVLYQRCSNSTLTSGDLITLFSETVTELISQKPTSEVVVWPEYPENPKENRTVSHHTFHHQSCSSTPVLLQDRPQNKPEQELLQEDWTVLPQEVHVFPSVSSSGTASPNSITSAESFTSAPSSPPAVRSEASSRCGDILPLQKPFVMFKDEDFQVLDDGQMSSEDLTPCCPDLTLTLEGTTEAIPFRSLRRASAIELDIYESGVEEILTCASPGNFSDPTESPVEEMTKTQKRLKSKFNLPLQCYSNEDNQAEPSTAEICVDSHNFLMPDYEKIVNDKVVSEGIIKTENVTEDFSMFPTEQKTESVYHQDSVSTEASETGSFLELKPLRRSLSFPRVEGCLEFSQDAVDQPEILTSCAITETMQDLLGQIYEQDISEKERKPSQSALLASLRSSILDVDLNPKSRGSCTHQLQSSPRSGLTCSPQISPSEQLREKSSSEGKTAATKDTVCFRTTPDRVGHCKLGSWWKQALETRRASTGLLPAVEQVSAVTKEKRGSLVIGQSQFQGPISFLESSAKYKGGKKEVKQADKEESTSRRESGNLAPHPVDQESAAHRGQRGKKGKRFKRT